MTRVIAAMSIAIAIGVAQPRFLCRVCWVMAKTRATAKAIVYARSVLLQMLAEGEGHGRELAQRAKELSGDNVDLGDGSIYPALRELETEGLAVSRIEPGGRFSRVYRITAAGRQRAKVETLVALSIFRREPSRQRSR